MGLGHGPSRLTLQRRDTMEKLFNIASRISTPLALSGFVVLIFFLLIRQLLDKNIFPTLTKKLSSDVIKLIIRCIFILSLLTVLLGSLGYVIPMLMRDTDFSENNELTPFPKGVFGILTASFSGEHSELNGKTLRNSITHTLNARFRELNISNTEAKNIPNNNSNKLKSHQEARKIGKKYSAEIVIWGDITFKGVIPNLTIVDQSSTTSFLTDSNATLFKESLKHNAIFLDDIRLPAFTDEPTQIVCFVTALKYYNEKKYKSALYYLTKAIPAKDTSHINCYPIFLFMGNCCNSMQEYDDAINFYIKAIAIDPKLPNAFNNRGIAYCFKHQYNLAINDYQTALELSTISSITSAVSFNLRNAYINQGNQFIFKGENEKAISYFDKAIELDSNHPNAYIMRGTSYSFNGEYGKAISDYDKAIILDSNSSSAYSSLGSTYANMGKYDKAIAAFNNAIKIDPENPTLYFNKAHTCREIGNVKGAVDAYYAFIQYASYEPQLKHLVNEAQHYINSARE